MTDIFFDLDNTLIDASADYEHPGEPVKLPSGRFVYVAIRAETEAMLAGARELGRVRILTAATRDYAVPITALLGFAAEDVIVREDYFSLGGFTGYSRQRDLIVEKRSQFPRAVLIDDLPPENPYAQCKISFLGIPSERLIQVPAFYVDRAEPVDVEGILSTIKRLNSGLL